jgi:hypothetical protein
MTHVNKFTIPVKRTGETSRKGYPLWEGFICLNEKPLSPVSGTEIKKEKEKKDASGTWIDHKVLLNIGDDSIGAISFLPRGKKEDGTLKKQMLIADIQFGDFYFPTSGLLNEEAGSVKLEYSEYGFNRNEDDTSEYKKNYLLEDPTFNLDDAIDGLAKAFPEYQEWYSSAFPTSDRFESKEVKSERLNNIFALAKGRAKKEELDWS